MKFQSIRFSTGTETQTPKVGWNIGDKFYIDDDGFGKWKILKKTNSYKSTQSIQVETGTVADSRFGDSVCAQRNNQYVVVGQASSNRIHVYTPQPIDLKPFMVIQSKVVDVGEFGKSVATGQFIKLDKTNKYDDWDSTYEWVVVGALAQTVRKEW